MDSALDRLDFTNVPGSKTIPKLTVYALSTCAICSTAMKYLKDQGHEFSYILMDEVPADLKKAAKDELKQRYFSVSRFPILIIDDERAITGFVERYWKDALE